MENIKIATVQFENASGNKEYNLSMIEKIVAEASSSGAEVVCFHECSVTGYSFARKLSAEELFNLAEPIPDGPSLNALTGMAKKYNVTILAGLFEKEGNTIYKAFVCVDRSCGQSPQTTSFY